LNPRNLVFRPEAVEELLEARKWYDACSPGLGLEFARAAEAAIVSAERNPQAYGRIKGEFRRVTLRRFPYSIIYLSNDAEILIVACFHQHREPNSWVKRMR
jgi:plasmid stabilization system protein ParE